MSAAEVGESAAPDAPIGRATARGFAGLSSARIISMVLQLVMFAALAGHLGEAGIGLFGFGLAAAQLFDVLANLGFKQVVTRDVAQDPTAERWLIPNYIYLRAMLGVLAFGCLVAFVFIAGYRAEEREVALIAGSLLLFTTPQATQPMLEVRLAMGPIAVANVVEAVLMLGGTLGLIYVDAGVTAFLWLYVATNLVNSLMIAVSAMRVRGVLEWKPRPQRWWQVSRQALVLGTASVFVSIYYQIDIALLTRLKPAVDVGNYTAAFQALGAVNVVPVVLSTVLAPVLARTVSQSKEVLQRRYGMAIHLVSFAAVPIAVGGALTAWRLLPMIPQFSEFGRGGVALSILSVAAGLILVTTILQATLIAGHLQRKLLWLAMLGAGANLALNIVAIPKFSLYGAAAATVFTEFVVLVQSQRLVRKHLDIVWPFDRTVKFVIPVGAMVVVAFATYSLPVLIQVPLIGIAYLLTVLLFGTIRFVDVAAIFGSDVGDSHELLLAGVGDPRSGHTANRYRAVRDTLGDATVVHFRSRERIGLGPLFAARAAGARSLVVHRDGQPIGGFERRCLTAMADEIHEPVSGNGNGILVVNEGMIGPGVRGMLTALDAVSSGLETNGLSHEIDVIGGPRRLWERLAVREIPVLRRLDLDFQPSRWHFVMAWRTRRRLAGRPDPGQLLVIAHTIAFGLRPLLRRTPTFVWVDASVRQWASLGLWRKVWPWTDLTLWWSLRRERHVFTNSTVVAFSEWAAEGVRFEVPDADIVVLSPGIDTERFCPPENPVPAGRRPVRILFVGGRFAEKGGFDLITATDHLRPDSVQLDVVTGDDIGEHVGVEVHRLGHSDPELVDLYQQADLFCMPTRADGSPFVILEALATATPVISTHVAAIESLVGPAGRIVDVGDIGALREAIEELVDDDEQRIELGRLARQRAEENFSGTRQAEKLSALLRERAEP